MLANINFSNAAAPTAGDFSPGNGLTTLAKTSQMALSAAGQNDGAFTGAVVGGADAHSGLQGMVVPWWIGLIALLILVKFVAEKNDEGAEFKNIRVGFFNIVIVTLMAVIGLTLLKWFFGLYMVPGIAPIVEAV